MPVLVAILAISIGYFVFQRSRELFFISVRDGRLLVVRGDCPDALLHDLADAVRRAGVRRGSIRAIKEAHGSRLTASGVDDRLAQRLRNIFGSHPSHLRRTGSGPRADRNLGQWLGIAWLAWLLAS